MVCKNLLFYMKSLHIFFTELKMQANFSKMIFYHKMYHFQTTVNSKKVLPHVYLNRFTLNNTEKVQRYHSDSIVRILRTSINISR